MEISNDLNSNIIQAIIQIAKQVENSKLSEEASKEIEEPLSVLTAYLNTSSEQSMLFAVIFALQAKINIIDLQDVINFLDISYIDSLNLKSDIDKLLEMNLIEIEEEVFRRAKKSKFGKSSFSIPDNICDQIYANQPLQIKSQVDLDIYIFIKTVSDYVQRRKFENITTVDLFFLVDELEEKNKQLEQISKIKSKLLIEDRTLLYEILNDHVNLGMPTGLEITLNDIYENPREKRIKFRQLTEKTNSMYELGYIELVNARFANDFNLIVTNKAIEFFMQEDASLFANKQKSKNIILNDNIIFKNMFYDQILSDEVGFLTQSLMNSNFTTLQDRLTGMGLTRGIAAIFYGSSGTGKTETVYQIAKATGRNIVKIDISQSKSMWYGESEKLIKKVFIDYDVACKQCSLKPILLFNEADAILGKRQDNNHSNVSQTENAIQNILLEELETFEGIMIATTNLEGNLDAAFERRFLFKVKFDKPSTKIKSNIWLNKLNWIDNTFAIQLAKDFSFSGGEIDNVIRKITMKEVLTGKRPDVDEIYSYCQNEKLLTNKKEKIRIGYI